MSLIIMDNNMKIRDKNKANNLFEETRREDPYFL
jgi:hypothetical protein